MALMVETWQIVVLSIEVQDNFGQKNIDKVLTTIPSKDCYFHTDSSLSVVPALGEKSEHRLPPITKKLFAIDIHW